MLRNVEKSGPGERLPLAAIDEVTAEDKKVHGYQGAEMISRLSY